MADRVLFLVGVSGVGKTAALRHLSESVDFNGSCYFFDDIGVPSEAEMLQLEGSAESWQAQATRKWVEKLAVASEPLSVLEGQTTPFCLVAEAERSNLRRWRTILLECDPATRQLRLAQRGQPELASPRMDNWATFLRAQADALRIPVIDTSELSITDVAAIVREFAERL